MSGEDRLPLVSDPEDVWWHDHRAGRRQALGGADQGETLGRALARAQLLRLLAQRPDACELFVALEATLERGPEPDPAVWQSAGLLELRRGAGIDRMVDARAELIDRYCAAVALPWAWLRRDLDLLGQHWSRCRNRGPLEPDWFEWFAESVEADGEPEPSLQPDAGLTFVADFPGGTTIRELEQVRDAYAEAVEQARAAALRPRGRVPDKLRAALAERVKWLYWHRVPPRESAKSIAKRAYPDEVGRQPYLPPRWTGWVSEVGNQIRKAERELAD